VIIHGLQTMQVTGNNAINQILEKHEILVTHAHLMSGSL
jgi:hypothetical protein